MPDAAQVTLVIDREKANTFGVTFADINSHDLGQSRLVLCQRLSQCRPHAARDRAGRQGQRMQTEDLLKLNVRNASGGMVPLSAFANVEWQKGPSQIVGYNGYPSVRIGGQAGAGIFVRRCHRRNGTAGARLPERLRL